MLARTATQFASLIGVVTMLVACDDSPRPIKLPPIELEPLVVTQEPNSLLRSARLARRPAHLGDPLRVDVTYLDAPPGSGLVVELVFDPERGLGRPPPMPNAPLIRRPMPISGSGVLPITWDGRRRLCNEGDLAVWCAAVPGRFRIRATLYDRADFNTVGWPPSPPPKVLGQTYSERFTLPDPA